MHATNYRGPIAFALLSALLIIGGCGSGDGDGNSSIPIGDPLPPISDPPPSDPPPSDPPPSDPPPSDPPPSDPPPSEPPPPEPPPSEPPPPEPPPAHKNLFTQVSNAVWDETAVRKVLHAFAFGGQASDGQIGAWASMAPEFAIAEMLTFDEHNLKLSPPAFGDTDGLYARGGTLRELGEFWASNNPVNGVTPENRARYDISNNSGLLRILWTRAAISRGLNPFRQKIGLWETNYHLAVNLSTVAKVPLLRYYDDIMAAHEQGLPYQEVMGIAASSAAIALQYGHHTNRYRNGICDCNEDFAREYHQLFFGILGVNNPQYHESVTIKNTAKAFTDMTVHRDDVTGLVDFVDFGTFYHPTGQLEILGTMVGGSNAAERIAEMIDISINHPESLANLPVMIVRDLADDNLNSTKISAIRAAWAAMGQKHLLTFLRGYAISTIFHDTSRVKYHSSIDRHVMLSNLVAGSNREHYLDLYWPRYAAESVQVFFPTHNVFGSQTGIEAAASDLVFRKNFNLVTETNWHFRKADGTNYGQNWEKDWAARITPNTDGNYVVKDVAEWLWQHFLADGLKNFGPLERAQVYSLLAEDRDLAYLSDPDDVDRIITTNDVLTDSSLVTLVNNLAGQRMDLGTAVADDRLKSNLKVGMAINFIVGTPYIFAQEGR